MLGDNGVPPLGIQRELFADERCSEAILEFLRTTDVGRKVPTEKPTEAESSESGTDQECPRGRVRVRVVRGRRAGLTRFAFLRLIFHFIWQASDW